jgi:hypothetical protein
MFKNLDFNTDIRANFEMELRDGTSRWNFEMELRDGTSRWNFETETARPTLKNRGWGTLRVFLVCARKKRESRLDAFAEGY